VYLKKIIDIKFIDPTYNMELIDLDIKDFPADFNWHNDQFPPLDALTYWHFLVKAKRVIEVGCGYSTQLAWQSGIQVTAVDPQPRVFSVDIPYILKSVQEVEIEIFEELQENDILFIDSSHVYGPNSDVEFLIHKVIPKLKKGVLIHFHDYFGMYGYPKEWQKNPEMKLWNENDVIIGIVHDFELLAFNYYLSEKYNDELKKKYDFVPNNIISNLGAVKGASLWIKK